MLIHMSVINIDHISHFKEGREDVNDDAHSGRPSTSTTNGNIEAVKKIILDNHQLTITEVADDVGILREAIHKLNMQEHMYVCICNSP